MRKSRLTLLLLTLFHSLAKMTKQASVSVLFQLLILMTPMLLYGQDQKVFSKNRLHVTFSNGVLNNKATPYHGDYNPKTPLSYNHIIRLAYERMLTGNFSLQGGLGYGMQAIHYVFTERGSSLPKNIGRRYFDLAIYTETIEAELLAGYNPGWSFRPDFRITGGVGIQRNYPLKTHHALSVNEKNYSLFTFEIFDKTRPFISVGSDIMFPTKGYNKIQLGIHYKQFFSDWYTGNFYFYQVGVSGTTRSRGSYLSLGLGYVFTGDKRAKTLLDLEAEGGNR